MKRLFSFLLMLAMMAYFIPAYSQKKADPLKNGRGGFEYFIGIVGNPSVVADMKWDDKQLQDLKDLGVNMLQLSIAWGGKPGNEVLNLEDLDEEQIAKWKYRIKQAEKHGFFN